MEAKDVINIVLEEYRSLRSEIIQRNTIFNSILTVSGTISAGVLGVIVQSGFERSHVVGGALVIVVVLALLFLAYLLVDHDTQAAMIRIQEIEKFIEERAGEPLILWDRKRTDPADGYGVQAGSLLNKIKKWAGIGQTPRALNRQTAP